jgi:DNA polymerase-3 subunit gamma/tau
MVQEPAVQQYATAAPQAQYQQPIPAVATAPPPPKPATATTTAAPKPGLGNLQSLLQKVKSDQETASAGTALQLTTSNLLNSWKEYLESLRAQQKSALHTNLSVINMSVTGPEDITMDCPSTLAHTFANAERLTLIDYLQQQFGNKRLKVYIKLNELAPEKQVRTVMSKSEIFAAMVEKNPLLKELKDNLNLELDYM